MCKTDRSSSLPHFLIPGALLLAFGAFGAFAAACASPVVDAPGTDSGDKTDGLETSGIPFGTFRHVETDERGGYSILVLREDWTYYSEHCEDVPSSAGCVRGHERFEPDEAGVGWRRNGNVMTESGRFRLVTGGLDDDVTLELDPDWTTYTMRLVVDADGEGFQMTKLDDYWGDEVVATMRRATPVCWVDADCAGHEVYEDQGVCVFRYEASPGECMVETEPALGTFRSGPTESREGFSALVLRDDGSFYSEFCDGALTSDECLLGHEADWGGPTGDTGGKWTGPLVVEWGTYRFVRPLEGFDADHHYIDFAARSSARDVWRVDVLDPNNLEIVSAGALFDGNPAQPMLRTDPICWDAVDCSGQGEDDGTSYSCARAPHGPGLCMPL